jgi:hypothetical protein
MLARLGYDVHPGRLAAFHHRVSPYRVAGQKLFSDFAFFDVRLTAIWSDPDRRALG